MKEIGDTFSKRTQVHLNFIKPLRPIQWGNKFRSLFNLCLSRFVISLESRSSQSEIIITKCHIRNYNQACKEGMGIFRVVVEGPEFSKVCSHVCFLIFGQILVLLHHSWLNVLNFCKSLQQHIFKLLFLFLLWSSQRSLWVNNKDECYLLKNNSQCCAYVHNGVFTKATVCITVVIRLCCVKF